MTSGSVFSWPDDGPVLLKRARIPEAVAAGIDGSRNNGLLTTDLLIADGKIADTGPALSSNSDRMGATPQIDMAGRIVLPGFVDIHTHLDKGHIWPRTPNPDGTFDGALTSARADRAAHWSADDVGARMRFALECAYAHGTVAVRTHLDSFVEQTAISWGVFDQVRTEFAGKVDLQPAALTSVESIGTDDFLNVVRHVKDYGGVLGTVAFPIPDLTERLDLFFKVAMDEGLEADFHADETQDPNAACLHAIAEAKLRSGYDKPVLVGHCCSLARQSEEMAEATLDLVQEAGLNIVSLPMCNSYLQDRHAQRTPRSRGVTLVHEMHDRGIQVAFASDNTRDPFYAYGDLDMLEVMREATRIAHLDHPFADWPAAFSGRAAQIIGMDCGVIKQGAKADMILVRARDWTELLSRPHSDRLVVRAGRAIDAEPPDYSELDGHIPPFAD